MNKYAALGIIAGLGLLAVAFGAWAKITHQPYSDTAMYMGRLGRIAGVIALFLLLFLWVTKKDKR